MDFAVLVKGVPPADRIRYDALRRTVVREGVELLLNPFDQRAVRVALELRRPGETVSVLSLGPPAVGPVLGELRQLGVDRVLLLTDPAFAGSDALATARSLASGLGRVGHDLVLAGARTTDSETGEVGPEVAALLGVPVLSEARSVRRDATGSGFEVSVDTPVGWASYRAHAPLLVSVGEKITKPLKAAPEARSAGTEPRIEIVSAAELGVDPTQVGAAGSRTVVESVEEVAPARSPRLFSEGSIAERVRDAAAALAPFLLPRRPRPVPWAEPSRPLRDDREVLVLASDENSDLAGEALAAVAEVRRALPDHWPSVLWVGRPPSEAGTFRLERAGALAGYHVPTRDGPPESRAVALGVGSVLDARPHAAAVLILSDPFGREVAGQLAARRGLGLVGDAVGVTTTPPSLALRWAKPSFGGRTVAQISCRSRPGLATVRAGAFAPPPDEREGNGFGWRTLPPVDLRATVERVAEGRETEGFEGIARREVLVVVGMGVGGPEGIARVRALVAPWNAGLVATRRVVDAGWMPRQLQVGLTGRQLAPRLAVLLGVSGSPNHMVGWRRAPALLAVNGDPEAPVFRDVSVGVVGPIESVLPPLVAGLTPLLGR